MKKKIIAIIVALTLVLAPVSVMAAPRSQTTVTRKVEARADGGSIETTVETTVSWEDKGANRRVKTTVVTTTVVEKAADGFVESTKTTETTTVETITTSTTTTTRKTITTTTKSSMYVDVSKKKVGTKAYKAIKYLKAHGAFKGVVSGKRFYPNRKITKKEYLRILRNLYGTKYAPWTSKSKAKVTERYALQKLVQVAKNMGMTIKWNGRSNTITRADAAGYIKIFADFDPAFKLH